MLLPPVRAPCLQATAKRAVSYDDDVIVLVAHQVDRAADRTGELADAQATIGCSGHRMIRKPRRIPIRPLRPVCRR